MSNSKNLQIVFSFIAVLLSALLAISIITLLSIKRINGNPKEELKLLQLEYLAQMYYSITDDATSIENETIKSYIDNNALSGLPVLMIGYSNFSCSNCMNYLLEGLEIEFPNYSVESRIVFIATGYKGNVPVRYGNTIVLKSGEELGFASEESNEPFIFVERNGIVFHVFSPNPDKDAMYKTYLSTIKEKYFSEKSKIEN